MIKFIIIKKWGSHADIPNNINIKRNYLFNNAIQKNMCVYHLLNKDFTILHNIFMIKDIYMMKCVVYGQCNKTIYRFYNIFIQMVTQ